MFCNHLTCETGSKDAAAAGTNGVATALAEDSSATVAPAATGAATRISRRPGPGSIGVAPSADLLGDGPDPPVGEAALA